MEDATRFRVDVVSVVATDIAWLAASVAPFGLISFAILCCSFSLALRRKQKRFPARTSMILGLIAFVDTLRYAIYDGENPIGPVVALGCSLFWVFGLLQLTWAKLAFVSRS